MVDVAKNSNPNVIKYGPISPISTLNAEAVRIPASIDLSSQHAERIIVIPLIEEVITESIRTSTIDTSARRAGEDELAAAAAIGASASPASFQNRPQATP